MRARPDRGSERCAGGEAADPGEHPPPPPRRSHVALDGVGEDQESDIIVLLSGLMIGVVGVYAWLTGLNNYVGTTSLIVLVVIGLLAELVEFLAGSAGAKKAGGSKRAAVGAIVGAGDRIEATVGDPRRTVGTDDHAVRRRPGAERDLRDIAGPRVRSAVAGRTRRLRSSG